MTTLKNLYAYLTPGVYSLGSVFNLTRNTMLTHTGFLNIKKKFAHSHIWDNIFKMCIPTLVCEVGQAHVFM